MAPTSSNKPARTLSDEHRKLLLKVAADSVRHGVEHHCPLPIELAKYPKEVQPVRATFVTLERRGQLRGCIGNLKATLPLVRDVAENAFAAAFRDPRFDPIIEEELYDLDIHISVLSEPVPMSFTSEKDLLAQLRPGVDGIILAEGWNRGTFLPSVWEELPDPAEFLRHLKMKAGLPTTYWSSSLQAWRYTTEYFP